MTPEGGGNKATKAPPPVPAAAIRGPSHQRTWLGLREPGGSPLPSQRGCAVRSRENTSQETSWKETTLFPMAREGDVAAFPGESSLAMPRVSAALEKGGGTEEGVSGGR